METKKVEQVIKEAISLLLLLDIKGGQAHLFVEAIKMLSSVQLSLEKTIKEEGNP